MKKIIYFLVSSMIIITSCGDHEDHHNTIYFKNESRTSIYVYAALYQIYKDTLINFGNPADAGDYYLIEPNFVDQEILRDKDSYERILDPNETLLIFVFDAQLVDTTPWDTIVENYKILKRYDLTLNDLDRLNWTITFP